MTKEEAEAAANQLLTVYGQQRDDFPRGVILFDEVLLQEAYASIELTLESDAVQVTAHVGDRVIHGKWVPREAEAI